MTELMHYAFIDESGTVGVNTGTHFLVVALINTDTPREIELPVRRASKKYGRSLKHGEIKASSFEEKAVFRLLRELAKQNLTIFSTIIDQKIIQKPPKDKESLYRAAIGRTIFHLVKSYPKVSICLDQRYTNEKHRLELESIIRETIQNIPQKSVMIQQENSIKRKELQAADAVAWALFQKYEHNKPQFYNLMASKIKSEDLIAIKDWSNFNK